MDRGQGDEPDVLENSADTVFGVGTPPGDFVGHVRHPDREPGRFAGTDETGDVALPAREPAVMVADEFAVDPNAGVAGSRKDIDKRFLMSETVRTSLSDLRSSDRINSLSDERK